ncbi:Fungal specific transcription factor [Ophiocordyceps camponoti-floridani]|uniref:Fungal specific transcription factor n=1 Tax=Ophiocordyceps camponoti-floridani TaxID=2030778 RepID=A0A8H4VCT5_9HYPO|nr:Fungal specific transcription factor [Ophiocordyceps camponoti-floridani]
MAETPPDNGHGRTACTECQRRKQKCNRVWPCNHCQKRKVADKCRFSTCTPAPVRNEAGRKRELSHDDLTDSSDTSPWDDGDSGFGALGYTAGHLFSGLAASDRRLRPPVKQQRQYRLDVASCPQLERVLHVLPPRPYTDALVQNFLNSVNFHYYIIYPPSFLDEYRQWWASRSENQPLGLQWTCLLLMVCACSAQYTDIDLQRKLEQDLGVSTQRLTESYHNAARELHSVIPVGNNHLYNVQSLLHSCYWYKSEARFVECWHVLSAAVREAQELDIHQELVSGPMSEFEREMRRRVWCVLDTWDWRISALLSRPMIIDRTDCEVGLPSLKLEGYSPSPLLHMKLQSELIAELAHNFKLPKNVVSPAQVFKYQTIIESWMSRFPTTYAFEDADESSDLQRPWIVLHRHYLRTMSYSMILDPIRAYLARPITAASHPDELRIRSDGIDYSLRLMDALYGFFGHVYPRDAKFHFVLFCIFDTAAVLCSALMHDGDGSIPRRQDVIGAIDGAVDMLRRLANVTKTAKTSYDILSRVSQRVMRVGNTDTSSPDTSRRRKKMSRRTSATAVTSHSQPAFPPMNGERETAPSYVTYGTSSPRKMPMLASHTPGQVSTCSRSLFTEAPTPTYSAPTSTSSNALPSTETPLLLSTPPVDRPVLLPDFPHPEPPAPYMTVTNEAFQQLEFDKMFASCWIL